MVSDHGRGLRQRRWSHRGPGEEAALDNTAQRPCGHLRVTASTANGTPMSVTPPETRFDIARSCRGLRLAEDGLWLPTDAPLGEPSPSYPAHGHATCYRVEDDSYWFLHRTECIGALLEAHPPGGTILDVGGGNGFISKGLQDRGHDVVMVEPGPDGARNAKDRGVRQVVCSTLERAAIAPGAALAVGLFDVLEHVADEGGFLAEIHRLLRPGGRLYVTVPAHELLWSQADENAGHQRRYTLSGLERGLRRVGFVTHYASYIFRPLPLPVLLLRALPWRFGRRVTETADQRRSRANRQHATGNTLVRRALLAALSTEIENVRRSRPMRFGGSCLVAASRPGTTRVLRRDGGPR